MSRPGWVSNPRKRERRPAHDCIGRYRELKRESERINKTREGERDRGFASKVGSSDPLGAFGAVSPFTRGRIDRFASENYSPPREGETRAQRARGSLTHTFDARHRAHLITLAHAQKGWLAPSHSVRRAAA